MTRALVIVTDPIDKVGIDRLRSGAEVVDLARGELSETELTLAFAHAQALIIRGDFRATPEALDACPRLELITKHGSGVDNIDVDAATERGICVANTPGGANASAVAEGAIGLMLAVQRRVIEAHQWVREGRFALRTSEQLEDLTGKTVGIVGFGNIGRAVARICSRGFDMPVIVFDPYVGEATMADAGVERAAQLEDLLSKADIVTLHMPLTEQTWHIIDARTLAAMKPEAILINTARGPLVNEAALAAALKSGTLRAAGLDVFEAEPPSCDNPLLHLETVVLSPHLAGITRGSLQEMALTVAQTTLDFLQGIRPETLLNETAWPNHGFSPNSDA